jgi:SAM-dependent methyltransferase
VRASAATARIVLPINQEDPRAMATMPTITRQVQDLYTRFPYPPPGVLDGAPVTAVMDYTRHIFWPSRSDLAGLRVLDAGCGTGANAVSIAQHHPDIQVVGIDLSESSLRHARALADRLGVGNNLQLRCMPVEDVGSLGQQFDYIVASGVIHHLDDPLRGLRALTDVLVPDGGMSLMLYATYGRAGVYMLQEAIRVLGAGADYPELAVMARSLLKDLPPDHPFNVRDMLDVTWDDDAGIVDLLLHVRDRSYSVPQVFQLLDDAGLQLTRFVDRMAYDPAMYIQDPAVTARFDGLDPRARAAVAELLNGKMRKHGLYATREGYVPYQPTPSGLVLLALRPRRSPLYGWSSLERVGKKRHQQLRLTEQHVSEEYSREFDFAPWQMSVVTECDGLRTAMEVFSLPHVQQMIPGADLDDRFRRFGELLEILADQEVILCN